MALGSRRGDAAKVLLVNPSALSYSQNYMRLEPLGLERVAQAVRMAGHEVRLLDMQVFGRAAYRRTLGRWRPAAVGLSLNYLANVPEVLALATEARRRLPESFVFVGGHTASFIPNELLEHAGGAIDCVVRGDGEITVQRLLEEIPGGRFDEVPGVVSLRGAGPAPSLISPSELDACWPARDLLRRRRRYFIGDLDPCASIEFTRGCPYECSFCSAWTFYNRTYRKVSPQTAAEQLSQITEPNVFVVDDVAFLDPRQTMEIADEIDRRGIRKRYFVETRCDTLIRHEDVFARWKDLGLRYLFLGVEALDAEGLDSFHKRLSVDENRQALEIARRLGVIAAVNIIVSPQWDQERFHALEQWARGVPEVVHLTIMMPYPGAEIWPAEAPNLITHDYRLFDTQHAVTATKLPLRRFYEEFTRAQMVLFRRHLNKANLVGMTRKILRSVLHGRTNLAKSTLNFRAIPNPRRRYADHSRSLPYALRPPAAGDASPPFVHARPQAALSPVSH